MKVVMALAMYINSVAALQGLLLSFFHSFSTVAHLSQLSRWWWWWWWQWWRVIIIIGTGSSLQEGGENEEDDLWTTWGKVAVAKMILVVIMRMVLVIAQEEIALKDDGNDENDDNLMIDAKFCRWHLSTFSPFFKLKSRIWENEMMTAKMRWWQQNC